MFLEIDYWYQINSKYGVLYPNCVYTQPYVSAQKQEDK